MYDNFKDPSPFLLVSLPVFVGSDLRCLSTYCWCLDTWRSIVGDYIIVYGCRLNNSFCWLNTFLCCLKAPLLLVEHPGLVVGNQYIIVSIPHYILWYPTSALLLVKSLLIIYEIPRFSAGWTATGGGVETCSHRRGLAQPVDWHRCGSHDPLSSMIGL